MENIKSRINKICVYVFTAIYLLLAYFFIFDHNVFAALELNEKGDALAGIFAPLAFLWLVFGYLQQGQELKQNTKALKLQAEELKNSVEQQKQLVEVTQAELQLIKKKDERQIKSETINAQPFFHFANFSLSNYNSHSRRGVQLNFRLKNSRSTCRPLNVYAEPTKIEGSNDYTSSVVTELELIKTTENYEYDCYVVLHPQHVFKDNSLSIDVSFRYNDAFDDMHIQKFRFILYQSFGELNQFVINSHYIQRNFESYKHTQEF